MADSRTPLGIYVHVPFCAARCGYCDFNTYVPRLLGQQSEFVEAALAEMTLARGELGDRAVTTVFIGGGTPTLLGADELLRLLHGVEERFTLTPGAEVTTEANPESVNLDMLRELRAGGFTRLSLGMQSATPHVLRTLDREHTAGRAAAAALEARTAGFEHVSLDLIYGTPGETDEDWERTLDAALGTDPDHISAYALTVEPGTAMRAAVVSGRLPAPDDADQARRFTRADERLQAAGLSWYELSSWAASESSAAATTSATGAHMTGGGWVPGRTRTSMGCAGGTCCSPRPTRNACVRACHPRPGVRPSPSSSVCSRRSCWAYGSDGVWTCRS